MNQMQQFHFNNHLRRTKSQHIGIQNKTIHSFIHIVEYHTTHIYKIKARKQKEKTKKLKMYSTIPIIHITHIVDHFYFFCKAFNALPIELFSLLSYPGSVPVYLCCRVNKIATTNCAMHCRQAHTPAFQVNCFEWATQNRNGNNVGPTSFSTVYVLVIGSVQAVMGRYWFDL